MLIKKQPTEKSGIDLAIDDILLAMKGVKPDSPEYALMTKQLKKLHAMKVAEKPSNMHPETVALIVGNLLGIGMILQYEKVNIITTKALGFISKFR